MTNLETALQSMVGQIAHVRLLVRGADGPGSVSALHSLFVTVQEVMEDSFVGDRDGETVYVPFHAIAFISTREE